MHVCEGVHACTKAEAREAIWYPLPSLPVHSFESLPEHETFVSARLEAGKSQQLPFPHPHSGSWGYRHFQGCLACYMSARIQAPVLIGAGSFLQCLQWPF